MLYILRNLILAIIGITVFVALLAAGFFIGLGVLAAGILFWAYIKLRTNGIIQQTKNKQNHSSSTETITIETEYRVIAENENPDKNPTNKDS